jgi:hypothetical protein
VSAGCGKSRENETDRVGFGQLMIAGDAMPRLAFGTAIRSLGKVPKVTPWHSNN